MRISVTDLDQYQIWLEMEDVGPEWLIDRLTKFEPSPAMRAGSAFHKLMENVEQYAVKSFLDRAPEVDGFLFKFDVDSEVSIPAVREMKIERLVLPEIVLVGKVDGIEGQTIIDYKLTKTLDIERYTDSYQWRAYLMLFESRIFRYDIFEGSPDRGKELDYTIHAYHPLKFYAYDGMREDVLRCVSNLAEFIQKHNITTKLVTSESMD